MQDIRTVDTVEAGTAYLVPTLNVRTWKMSVPILEPEHDDIDVIRFPQTHWHIDWRFTTEAFLDHYTRVQATKHSRIVPPDQRFTGLIIVRSHQGEVMTDGTVTTASLTCRRQSPDFPVTWFTSELENRYSQAKAKNMICPHRGINLRGQPIECGRVTCPGHGLQFDIESGELVRRNRIKRPFHENHH